MRRPHVLGRASPAAVALWGATATALTALGSWLVFDDMAIAVAIAGLVCTLVGAPLVAPWLAGAANPAAGATALTREQRLGWCRTLRLAVLDGRADEGSQLDQMVRYGTVIDLRSRPDVRARTLGDGRSRLLVGGRTVEWSELTAEWDRLPGRMVILGEPGYGKTVAALRLLKHLNPAPEDDEHPQAVAELFPLIEWYRWSAQRGGHFGAWLADQLTLTYRLPPVVARELVNDGLVLPVLDGLDEVPAGERARCLQDLEAYAGRSPPGRPFILTCRTQDYVAIAPAWIPADHQVMLIGLEADQIAEVLEARTAGRPGWDSVRRRAVDGDPHLIGLFRSPLRLSVALEAYRDSDAMALRALGSTDAEGRLWDALLKRDMPTFRGAGPERVRSWLQYLAAAMERTDRQRFWLHELHLLVADRTALQRRFRHRLGLLMAIGVSLMFALLFALIWSIPVSDDTFGDAASSFALIACAALFGLLAALPILRSDEALAPSVRVKVPWRARLAAAMRASVAGLAILIASVFVFAFLSSALSGNWDGYTAGQNAGRGIGVGGLLVVVFYTVYRTATAGTTVVSVEPPRRLLGRHPAAILGAIRNAGFTLGLVVGLGFGFAIAAPILLIAATDKNFDTVTVVSFVLVTVISAIFLAIPSGIVAAVYQLRPWLYHRWLRRRLARHGALPKSLSPFLEWCSMPERGWLRMSDAYEFRHRDLLEHLAAGRDR